MDPDTPQPVVRKRIIVPPSDSDSELETPEKQGPQIVVANNSALNSKYNGCFRAKNPSVLEKEKQMKFLLEIFPNLEAMVIFMDSISFVIYRFFYF